MLIPECVCGVDKDMYEAYWSWLVFGVLGMISIPAVVVGGFLLNSVGLIFLALGLIVFRAVVSSVRYRRKRRWGHNKRCSRRYVLMRHLYVQPF